MVKPNTMIWIDIEESPSLSSGSRLAVDKDELLPRGNYLDVKRVRVRKQ